MATVMENPFVKEQLVRWVDSNNCSHYGRVIEVFRDTVTVEYGTGNSTRKKKFLHTDLDESNLRERITYTPRQLHAEAVRLSTKPGYEWTSILINPSRRDDSGADSVGSPASASPSAPAIKRPKNLPDDNLIARAEEFIRANNPASRREIMAYLEMSESDVPAYMAMMNTLLAEKRITRTGAKRGTLYHPAVTKS